MSGKNNMQKIEITPENKCSFCTGTKCCIYVTQEMETPRSVSDFDHMLWQMAHKDMQVYKDDDGWFLIAMNQCQFLQNDGGCGIYETRPQICRDYSNDFCEYDEPAEIHFEFYFKTYKELDDYCRKRFKRWDQRFEEE